MAFRGSTLKRFKWLSIIPHFGCDWWTHISHLSLPYKISPKKKGVETQNNQFQARIAPNKAIGMHEDTAWHVTMVSPSWHLKWLHSAWCSPFDLSAPTASHQYHQQYLCGHLSDWKKIWILDPRFSHLESLQLSRALHHEVHTRRSEVSAWRGEAIKTRKKGAKIHLPQVSLGEDYQKKQTKNKQKGFQPPRPRYVMKMESANGFRTLQFSQFSVRPHKKIPFPLASSCFLILPSHPTWDYRWDVDKPKSSKSSFQPSLGICLFWCFEQVVADLKTPHLKAGWKLPEGSKPQIKASPNFWSSLNTPSTSTVLGMDTPRQILWRFLPLHWKGTKGKQQIWSFRVISSFLKYIIKKAFIFHGQFEPQTSSPSVTGSWKAQWRVFISTPGLQVTTLDMTIFVRNLSKSRNQPGILDL